MGIWPTFFSQVYVLCCICSLGQEVHAYSRLQNFANERGHFDRLTCLEFLALCPLVLLTLAVSFHSRKMWVASWPMGHQITKAFVPGVKLDGYPLFSYQNLSPKRSSLKVSPIRQAKVGPTMEPGRGLSVTPPLHKSISSGCLKYKKNKELRKTRNKDRMERSE